MMGSNLIPMKVDPGFNDMVKSIKNEFGLSSMVDVTRKMGKQRKTVKKIFQHDDMDDKMDELSFWGLI